MEKPPAGVRTDTVPQSENDTENETTLERDDNESECSGSTDDGDVIQDPTTLELVGSYPEAQEDQHGDDNDRAEEEEDLFHDQNQFLELTTPLLRKLQRRQIRFITWESLLSTVSYAGRKNMTATQYSYLRSALLAANNHLSIRTYKTMRTTFWTDLKRVSFPRIDVTYLGRKEHHRTCRKKINSRNAGMKNVQDCAAIVLPSEWAKLDVLSYHFYHDVYESDQMHRPVSIEKSPIIQHRTRAMNEVPTIWANYKNAPCPVDIGDTLLFPCNGLPRGAAASSITSSWKVSNKSSVDHFGERCTITEVEGSVGPLWMVENTSCASQDIQNDWDLSEEEKKVYQTLRETAPHSPRLSGPSDCNAQATIPNMTFTDGLFLHAGDTVAMIRPDRNTSSADACLFIASMLSQVGDGVTERLVWVSVSDSEGTRPRKYLKITASVTVSGIPTWKSGSRTFPTFPRQLACNRGVLSNGKRYLVYRIVLYTDGFGQLKSLSDQREVGGVYILPIGLPTESKRSWSGARVISLTPDGHSMNKVLTAIEGDLVLGATTGIPGLDPYGRPVQIFLDTVGYFGDYPAVTATTDVRGHNATAFCTFCTFREVHNAPGGSKMYSTDIHSRRLGVMRWDSRRDVVRSKIPTGTLERRLGFSTLTEDKANELPLVSLAKKLRRSGRARTQAGRPVVPYGFDSVQSTAAAPDHLLSGLIDDVLWLCFTKLQTEEEQNRTEALICSNAKRNGLDTQGRFMKWKNGKPDGLRSVTMSTNMCILLAAAPTFRQHYQRTGNSVFLLPQKLQNVIACMYDSPSVETEGEDARDAYSEYSLLCATGRRVMSAKAFIQSCSREHKKDPAGCKRLNKPNVHRLLELCCHTIVNYGHGLNCSEMVLESMHRRFKNWLETNPHADSHISAVEKALSADWMGRVSILYRTMTHGTEQEKACAELGLRRFLLGEEAVKIDTSAPAGAVLKETFLRVVHPSMRQPVLSELDLCMPLVGAHARTYVWCVEKHDDKCGDTDELQQGQKMLESWRDAYVRSEPEDILWYKNARYAWKSKFGGSQRSYQHHTITRGTAVSIVVGGGEQDRPVITECSDIPNGKLEFYAVYGIMYNSDLGPWCVVKRLLQQGEGYTVRRSKVAILRLGNRVRRVAVFHHCDPSCKVNAGQLKVRHSSSLLNGGVYRIARRVDGYPPHLG